MGIKKEFLNSRNISLCGILNKCDSDEYILMVHGFAGNKEENGLFEKASDFFIKEGFNTFTYDQTGIGESEGKYEKVDIKDLIDDYESAIMFLKRLDPNASLNVLGFSLGATIAILSDIRKGISSYSFWSPAFFPKDDMYPRYNTEEIRKELLTKGYIDKGPIKVGKKLILDLSRTKLNGELSQLTTPSLIVHGDSDERINYQNSLLAKNIIPNSEIRIINGEGHSYKNNPEIRNRVYGLTSSWFKNSILDPSFSD